MRSMDEQEPDFIAYIYLCRYAYYPRVQKEPCKLEKACVIKRTFI